MADDRHVTVAVFYSLPAALVARSALEAYGVRAHAIGAAHMAAQWTVLVALGGIEIRAPASQEAAARAILDRGGPVPLREAPSFWAAPFRNAALFALTVLLGTPTPFWIRRPRAKRRAPVARATPRP